MNTLPYLEIFQVLQSYQIQIEDKIQKSIPSNLGPKTKLREVCEYALMNGGKRFRPALVLMIAKALGNQVDVSQAALAVEYFHTASLIVDDLPCMDNDDERRHKPSAHKKYGENLALLASYALIAAGYECIAQNAQKIGESSVPFSKLCDRICVLALENATYNTGLHGATGGQFLDIYPPDLSLETLYEVIQKKTVSLFEISFVFGWLFGGGDLNFLDLVKKAAKHFGMAFQIADDLGDVKQDEENQRLVNLAGVFGKDAAKKMFHEEIGQFFHTLKELNLAVPELQEIAKQLIKQADLVL